MAVRSGVSGTGTARSVTKSECAVPLYTHDRTLVHCNIACRLYFQGAHFQPRGLVTHLNHKLQPDGGTELVSTVETTSRHLSTLLLCTHEYEYLLVVGSVLMS